jgi:tRNA A-37 threonylcarbamoyl transferase component Bud32
VADSGNVKIIQTIASGGTAVLHKAVQTSLDRIVAVKRLHKHLTDDENFTRRFILEAKAAAALDHENIVHVIDFGRYEDGYEIVMEFVEGDSLKEILDRWRPVKSDLALAIVHQICQGLEHAHSKGIVHRDIKPGNVMLTRAGRAKITDFGLAKLTEAAASHTADNSIIGTPLYMSPEQAFGESVDQRSDLFSLGTVLYELVTGRQPFASDNYMGVIQNIIHKDIVPPREVNEEVPEAVEAIILKALSKDREERFQSAREFREAIEELVGIAELKSLSGSLGVLLERNAATVVLPRPESRPARKRAASSAGRGRGVAAAVVAVVLVAAVGVVLLRPDLIERFSGTEVNGSPQPSGIQRSEAVVTPVETTFDLGALVETDSAGASEGAAAGVSAESIAVTRPVSPATTAPTSTPPATEPQPEPAAESEPARVVRKGYLSVNAEPGAEIYVDGVYRGDSPPALRLELVAGNHSLECRRPGHESYRESLRIVPGELSRRSVTLRKFKGMLSVATQEGAQIYVDGKLIGVTPLRRPLDIDAGDHMVTIKKPGFNTWSSPVTIRPKETFPLHITLSPRY